MVAKVVGLATGALVASIAVWGFNSWRHVSDDDRLSEVLAGHCLPYVLSGTVPFEGMGRAPGVYDVVDLIDGLEDGGAVLIHDARFVAQWGVMPDAGVDRDTRFRICEVKPSYADNTVAGFAVTADGFGRRYSDIIAPDGALVPNFDEITSGPQMIGWYSTDGDQDAGLRVVMTASPSLVSSILVGMNLSD